MTIVHDPKRALRDAQDEKFSMAQNYRMAVIFTVGCNCQPQWIEKIKPLEYKVAMLDAAADEEHCAMIHGVGFVEPCVFADGGLYYLIVKD